MNKKTLLSTVVAAALALGAGQALAQGRTLVLSTFGFNGALLKKHVFDPFEAQCGCKIVLSGKVLKLDIELGEAGEVADWQGANEMSADAQRLEAGAQACQLCSVPRPIAVLQVDGQFSQVWRPLCAHYRQQQVSVRTTKLGTDEEAETPQHGAYKAVQQHMCQLDVAAAGADDRQLLHQRAARPEEGPP